MSRSVAPVITPGKRLLSPRLLTMAFVGLLSIGFMSAKADAATYYVDPNGSNVSTRDGSSGQAWQTLSYAVSRVSGGQGHVIRLNAGTYNTSEVSFPTGLSLEGAGQSSTKIVFTGTSGYALRFGGGNGTPKENGNQFVKDLTVDGSNRTGNSGIYFGRRDNMTLRNVTLQYFKNEGLTIDGPGWYGNGTEKEVPPYLVSGIEVDGLNLIDSGSGNRGGYCGGVMVIGGTIGAKLHNINLTTRSDLPAYGIKYGNGGMNWGLKIYDSTFNGGGDFAIELFNVFGGSEIYNCTFNKMISLGAQKVYSDADATKPGTIGTANGNGPQTMRIHHNTFTGGTGGGYTVEAQISDMEFDHNYVQNPGVGISIGSAGDPDTPSEQSRVNFKIHHNVFWTDSTSYDHRATWVGTAKLVKNVRFYNNTCYGLAYGLTVAAQYSGTKAEDIYIKNNVFKNIRKEVVDFTLKDSNATTSNVVFDRNNTNNVTNRFGGSEKVTGLTDTNTTMDNPGLNESGNRPEPYYQPSSGSSHVVDKGTTTISPDTTIASSEYGGSAPDLGAYEWATSNGNGPNLLSNPGFEAEQYNTQTPSGWSEWSNTFGTNAGYTETYGGAKSGNYHGTHWTNQAAYNIYTFRAWIKSGGQTSGGQAYIGAKNFGGTERNSGNVGALANWTLVEVKDINVTNGTCEVFFWSSGPANQWMYFDDAEFFKQGSTSTLVNRATGGIASASSAPTSGEGAAQAFDNNTGTKWLGSYGTSGAWVGYQFANSANRVVSKYTITSANDYAERDPKNWTLQGWNGSSWVDLNSQSNQTFTARFQKKEYTFSNSTAYNSYRLYITANNGATLVQLSELELFAP